MRNYSCSEFFLAIKYAFPQIVGNFVRSEIFSQLNISFRKLQAVGYGIRPYIL